MINLLSILQYSGYGMKIGEKHQLFAEYETKNQKAFDGILLRFSDFQFRRVQAFPFESQGAKVQKSKNE